MTAFDIYSAIGGVSEDILEEAETPVRRRKISIAQTATVAACLAIFAAGVYFSQETSSPPEVEITVVTTDTVSDITGGETTVEFNETPAVTSEKRYEITSDAETTSSPETTSITEAVSDTVTEVISEKTTTVTETSVPIIEPPVTITDPIGSAAGSVTAITEPSVTATEISETTENTTSYENESIEEEIAVVPNWEDMSELERYICLDYNGGSYDMGNEVFEENELSFLCNGEIYGIDESSRDHTRYSKSCAFYKIKNISEDYMIAVLTADGRYRGFVNCTSYKPSDLGEYLEDTDFIGRNPAARITSSDITIDGVFGHIEYELHGLETEIEKLLTANPNAAREIRPVNQMAAFHVYTDSKPYIVLNIYESGYIYISGETFYIGEEYTNAFIEYVENNAEQDFIPYIPASDKEIIPE